MARGGLPWHILAMGATADWEDKAGLKIKQTGKKNLSCVSKSTADLLALPCLYSCSSKDSLRRELSICQQHWAIVREEACTTWCKNEASAASWMRTLLRGAGPMG